MSVRLPDSMKTSFCQCPHLLRFWIYKHAVNNAPRRRTISSAGGREHYRVGEYLRAGVRVQEDERGASEDQEEVAVIELPFETKFRL